MKQMHLFKEKVTREFGGSLLEGRRKTQRPLAFRGSNHLVLKTTSSVLLLNNQDLVKRAIGKYARRFGLKIYALAVQADHIHIHFRVGTRIQYNRWTRTVTARLVCVIPKLKWRLRPYTRMAHWGRDFGGLNRYVRTNTGEAQVILQAHEAARRCLERYGPESLRAGNLVMQL